MEIFINIVYINLETEDNKHLWLIPNSTAYNIFSGEISKNKRNLCTPSKKIVSETTLEIYQWLILIKL